jgi:hypothetical protein
VKKKAAKNLPEKIIFSKIFYAKFFPILIFSHTPLKGRVDLRLMRATAA